jgi:hypothetical protein
MTSQSTLLDAPTPTLRPVLTDPVTTIDARRPRRPRREIVSLLATGTLATAMLLASFGFRFGFGGGGGSGSHTAFDTGTGALVPTATNAAGQALCGSTGSTDSNCAPYDLFGSSPLVPGQPQTTTIRLGNAGTVAAEGVSVQSGQCLAASVGTASAAGQDFCHQVQVTISAGADVVYRGSAADLGGQGIVDLPEDYGQPHSATPLTFVVGLPAGAGNRYQGWTLSQPITFGFAE